MYTGIYNQYTLQSLIWDSIVSGAVETMHTRTLQSYNLQVWINIYLTYLHKRHFLAPHITPLVKVYIECL